MRSKSGETKSYIPGLTAIILLVWLDYLLPRAVFCATLVGFS